MEPKRQYTQQPTAPESSRAPSVPDDISTSLIHVGARARKHVSEGHLTSSARQYSFERQVEPAGPAPVMDDSRLWKDMRPSSKFSHRVSQPAPILKRRLDEDDDEDEGTDVDEPSEEKPHSMTELKAYYVPSNYRAASQTDQPDDFDDASFLREQQ